MSANIDTLVYVGETPWHAMGKDLSNNLPATSNDLIVAANLDWEVATIPVKTDLHDHVKLYQAVYRLDNNNVLGLVNAAQPSLVQNAEMFNAVEYLMKDDMSVEVAASLGHGERVFGCFKIHQKYKVFGDEVDHYFVVLNDHLKTDGKITVLNTPVRVVCQNTLSQALTNNSYKLRVPITSDASMNYTLACKIFESAGSAITQLNDTAEKMYAKKIDSNYTEKMLDLLFPYHIVDGVPIDSPGNEKVSLTRATFMDSCMGADNLQNVVGTQWQMFNALVDFTTHYYAKIDDAYDINKRMQRLPGIVAAAESNKVVQFLKMADKIA